MDDTAARGNGKAVADGINAKGNGTAVADAFPDKAGGIAVENGIAARANVRALVDDAAKPEGIPVLVIGNGTAVEIGIAARANVPALVDDAAKPEGIQVLVIGNGTAVENGIGARANVPALVDDAAKPEGIQRCWNLLKYIPVWIFKAFKFFCFSGVTELVNDSDVNIEFYTKTLNVSSPRFRLNARQTKHINMRELSASRGAKAATVVWLKVGGKYLALTLVPEDFIFYKKLKFSQNEMGELVCPKSDWVVRFPRSTALSTC